MVDGGLKNPTGLSTPLRPPPQTVGPRKPVHPRPYYPPKRKQRKCCCRLYFCCCCFIVILLVLLLALFGIFYAWYQPKFPVFRFKPVELDRFNVSTRPDGTAILNSRITIRVEVNNPSGKLKIYYGETKVSLTADSEIDLGTASLPKFTQPAGNVTMLKFTAVVDNKVVDSTVGLKLKSRVKDQKVVINAVVKTKVGFRAFNAKLGMLSVKVNCGGSTLKQLNNGKASPKCKLNTLNWINAK